MGPAVRTEPDTAGARLASARERIGWSLDQVADQLKLDRHTVIALEQDDYRAIGATVFVRGFLRRYAALVGESPADIEALYARRPDAEAQPDLSRTGLHRIEPDVFRPRVGLLPALIGALALTLAGAAWWVISSRPHAGTETTHPSSSALPVAAAPARQQSEPQLPAAASASATPAAETKPEAAPARRRLQLSYTGECWAEIYDARGVRLFSGFA